MVTFYICPSPGWPPTKPPDEETGLPDDGHHGQRVAHTGDHVRNIASGQPEGSVI